MHKLRDYQQELLDNSNRLFASGSKSVMAQLATGGGKTGIAAEWMKQHGEYSLFLCHTLSVIGQLPAEMRKWGVKAIPVSSAGMNWRAFERKIRRRNMLKEIGRLSKDCSHLAVGCTARTAVNNIHAGNIGQFSSVIVDEAHHAPDQVPGEKSTQTTEIVSLARQAGVPVLGITATPWRMSKRQGFSDTWDSLVCGPTWKQLMGTYLATPLVHTLEKRSRIVGSGGNRPGLDYMERETLQANIGNPVFIDKAFDVIQRHRVPGRPNKTVIFAVGQQHALMLAQEAHRRGIPAGLLISSSEMRNKAPDSIVVDRHEVNRRLQDGRLEVAINVNQVTEGYDLPDVDTVCCLRPTMSLALWRQICGRGSRLSDGKTHVNIIDMTDNHQRLGSPLDPYPWSLEPWGEYTEEGRPWMRTCEPRNGSQSCGHQMFVGNHNCPNCAEPQGAKCARCGKFRLWKKYTGMEVFYRAFMDLDGDETVCNQCASSRMYQIL